MKKFGKVCWFSVISCFLVTQMPQGNKAESNVLLNPVAPIVGVIEAVVVSKIYFFKEES